MRVRVAGREVIGPYTKAGSITNSTAFNITLEANIYSIRSTL
jgi:hypothetical protein